MNSRMDKYYKDDEVKPASRTLKNKNIYNKIDEDEYEKLNLTNNISVIDASVDDLDIDQIKKILDDQYKSQRRASVPVEDMDYIDDTDIDMEDTKEYDLKKVLETAHQNKKPDYEHDRFRKLRETQYDILKSLNLNKESEPEIEETLTVEEANLMNLIKTVNYNAIKNKSLKGGNDELLGDLMGSEKTEVLEPVSLDDTVPDKKPTIVEELEKTKQLSKKDIDMELARQESISKSVEEDDSDLESDYGVEELDNLSETNELANSFYTGKFQISDEDMDDFKDITSTINGGSIVIKILIMLLVIIILAVLVYLLNKYLNLGLF